MAAFTETTTLRITPTQYLDACTPEELRFLSRLLASKRYTQKMNPPKQLRIDGNFDTYL